MERNKEEKNKRNKKDGKKARKERCDLRIKQCHAKNIFYFTQF